METKLPSVKPEEWCRQCGIPEMHSAIEVYAFVGRVNNTDTLDVHVEMTPEMFTDNLGEIDKRQKDLVDGLKSMLGIKAKVTLVAPKSITRSEGKAVRVIDNRKI